MKKKWSTASITQNIGGKPLIILNIKIPRNQKGLLNIRNCAPWNVKQQMGLQKNSTEYMVGLCIGQLCMVRMYIYKQKMNKNWIGWCFFFALSYKVNFFQYAEILIILQLRTYTNSWFSSFQVVEIFSASNQHAELNYPMLKLKLVGKCETSRLWGTVSS